MNAEGRRDAHHPGPQLPPRQEQEHRRLQARRRRGDLRQADTRHRQADPRRGARDASRRVPNRRLAARFRLRILSRASAELHLGAKSAGHRPPSRGRATARTGSPAPAPRASTRPPARARGPDRVRSAPATTTATAPRLAGERPGPDACKADTDGDGVAGRLRVPSPATSTTTSTRAQHVPAVPGQAALPNALYADAASDYDGDGLPSPPSTAQKATAPRPPVSFRGRLPP